MTYASIPLDSVNLFLLYFGYQTAASNIRPRSMYVKQMLGGFDCSCVYFKVCLSAYEYTTEFATGYTYSFLVIVGGEQTHVYCVVYLFYFRSILHTLLCSGVAHSAGAEYSVRIDIGPCASARPIRQQSKTNDCG